MKKITLLVCLLITAFVNAQDEDEATSDELSFAKGTQFVNASFSAGLTNEKFRSLNDDQITEFKRKTVSTRVSYAYGIGENLFLGLSLRYIHQTNSDGPSSSNQDVSFVNNSYGVAPYLRYYKGIGKKLAVYLQGEAGYRHTNFGAYKTNRITVGLSPGITYMISKNFALETSIGFIGYSTSTDKNDTDLSERDSDQLIVSLSASDLFLGLNYYF